MRRRALLATVAATAGAGCLSDDDVRSDDAAAGAADLGSDDATDGAADGTSDEGSDVAEPDEVTHDGAIGGSWPLPDHDAGQTRHTDACGPRDAAPAWSVEAGSDEAGPIVVDGALLTDLGDEVAAFDAATGERRSGHPLDGVTGTPLGVVDGTLLALESHSALRAYDAASGEHLWTVDPDASVNYTVDEDLVYGRLLLDETLFAVDLAGGERVWSVDLGSANGPVAAAGELAYVVEWGGVRVVRDGSEVGYWDAGMRLNTVVADGDAAYVALNDGSIASVRPDATAEWTVSPYGFGNVLALTDDELYVTNGSTVEVVDRATGDVSAIGDGIGPAKYLSVDPETLYGVGDGRVAAWDRTDGTERWTHEFDARGEAEHAPVVLEDLVVVHWTAGSHSEVQAFAPP